MPKKHQFLPYTKARGFARKLRLRNRKEWHAYAKQHRTELATAGVPCSPEVFYLSPQAKYDRGYGYKAPTDPATKDIGAWVNWHDWLGSSYAPRLTAQFAPLDEFLAFLTQHRIATQAQYQHWRKQHYGSALYKRMPGAPATVYTSFSWKTVSPTVTGSPTTARRNKGGALAQQYAPFHEVRRKVRALKLVKREMWFAWVKDHPDDWRALTCPRHPETIAQYSSHWHGWADFLGSDTRANRRYKRD